VSEDVRIYEHLSDLPVSARALFDHAGRDDLFSTEAWYNTVLADGMTEDAAGRFVVCAGDSGAVLAAPMKIGGGGHHLDSLTTPYTCRYQPLCDPSADLTAPFVAFVRYCRGWPTVRFDAVDSDASWLVPLANGAARAGLAVRRFDHFGNWHEPVGGLGWAGYLDGRPGQLRETIRRRLGRARRAGGRFDIVRGGEALEPGIAAYEAVYARSWKPREPFPRFNATLMRAAAAMGTLRLGLYWLGDHPVAAQIWIIQAGQGTVLKLAHDEAAKAESPGTVLTALMLQHLLDEEQVTEIDFGRGDDPYKQLWAGQRRQRIGIVLANPRHPRGLAFLGRHALGQMRRALRG
jgi:hypothetical protein